MWSLALVEANRNMEMVHQLLTKISLDTMFRVSTREGRAGGGSLPCRPVEAHTGPLTRRTQRSLSGAGIVPMSTRRGTHWASNWMARVLTPCRPVEAHTGPLTRWTQRSMELESSRIVDPSRRTLGLYWDARRSCARYREWQCKIQRAHHLKHGRLTIAGV
jgi:hypothetical protein